MSYADWDDGSALTRVYDEARMDYYDDVPDENPLDELDPEERASVRQARAERANRTGRR